MILTIESDRSISLSAPFNIKKTGITHGEGKFFIISPTKGMIVSDDGATRSSHDITKSGTGIVYYNGKLYITSQVDNSRYEISRFSTSFAFEAVVYTSSIHRLENTPTGITHRNGNLVILIEEAGGSSNPDRWIEVVTITGTLVSRNDINFTVAVTRSLVNAKGQYWTYGDGTIYSMNPDSYYWYIASVISIGVIEGVTYWDDRLWFAGNFGIISFLMTPEIRQTITLGQRRVLVCYPSSNQVIEYKNTKQSRVHNLHARNDNAVGIFAVSESEILVANNDGSGDTVFIYDSDFVFQSDFRLLRSTATPNGIAKARGFIYIADNADPAIDIYQFDTVSNNWTRSAGRRVRYSVRGLAANEQSLYTVGNDNTVPIARYDFTDGRTFGTGTTVRQPNATFNLHADNRAPRGITIVGQELQVVDANGWVFRYGITDGTYINRYDLDPAQTPQGITTLGQGGALIVGGGNISRSIATVRAKAENGVSIGTDLSIHHKPILSDGVNVGSSVSHRLFVKAVLSQTIRIGSTIKHTVKAKLSGGIDIMGRVSTFQKRVIGANQRFEIAVLNAGSDDINFYDFDLNHIRTVDVSSIVERGLGLDWKNGSMFILNRRSITDNGTRWIERTIDYENYRSFDTNLTTATFGLAIRTLTGDTLTRSTFQFGLGGVDRVIIGNASGGGSIASIREILISIGRIRGLTYDENTDKWYAVTDSLRCEVLSSDITQSADDLSNSFPLDSANSTPRAVTITRSGVILVLNANGRVFYYKGGQYIRQGTLTFQSDTQGITVIEVYDQAQFSIGTSIRSKAAYIIGATIALKSAVIKHDTLRRTVTDTVLQKSSLSVKKQEFVQDDVRVGTTLNHRIKARLSTGLSIRPLVGHGIRTKVKDTLGIGDILYSKRVQIAHGGISVGSSITKRLKNKLTQTVRFRGQPTRHFGTTVTGSVTVSSIVYSTREEIIKGALELGTTIRFQVQNTLKDTILLGTVIKKDLSNTVRQTLLIGPKLQHRVEVKLTGIVRIGPKVVNRVRVDVFDGIRFSDRIDEFRSLAVIQTVRFKSRLLKPNIYVPPPAFEVYDKVRKVFRI